MFDRRMSANEEVRQHAAAAPPALRYCTDALPARNSAFRGIGATVAGVGATSKSSIIGKRIDVSANMTSLISSGPWRVRPRAARATIPTRSGSAENVEQYFRIHQRHRSIPRA